jgi:PAS domain S-box-containing protein
MTDVANRETDTRELDAVTRLEKIQQELLELATKDKHAAQRFQASETEASILTDNEQKFRALAEAGIIGILFSNQNGRILEMNPYLLELLGLSQEDVSRGLTWQELTPAQWRVLDAEGAAHMKARGFAPPYQKEFFHKDGSTVPVLIGAAIVGTDKRMGVGYVLDMSERVKAETALRESEENFRAMFELSSIGKAQADGETRRFLRVNQAMCDITGYSEAELLTMTVDDLNHPDDREADLARYQNLKSGKANGYASEKRYLRKDGSVIWVNAVGNLIRDEHGKPLRTLAVVQDITARKQAEETIRYQARLLDAVDQSVVATDMQGRIVFWNRFAQELFGWSSEEVLGKRVNDVTPAVFSKGQAEDIMEKLSRGETWRGEFFVRCKDGSVFPAFVTDSPIYNSDNEQIGIVGVAFDMSERKRLEQSLRDADKRKDEFLATLAHELRNPLAPMRSSLDLMKRSRDKRLQQESVDIIERQLEHVVRLVDDLLDVSRITRGNIRMQKETVFLSDVIALACEGSKVWLEEKQHRLILDLPEEAVRLSADKTRLVQVLLNLLSNAAKYTEAGGEILVAAEVLGDNVIIRVKDTGKGIPEIMLPHLFELFTRLERDAQQEGLGIGLHLVRQIVALHGGSVEARSAGLGQGSEFVIQLPAIKMQETKTREPLVTHSAQAYTTHPHTARRVLVIDDYEPNLKTLSRLLRVMGHEVLTARGGEEGLQVIASSQPSVVFLDINMPGMNGYEVAAKMSQQPNRQAIKLVALTGYGQAEDIGRTKAAGFDEHLVKPVDAGRLEQLLSS